MSFRKQRFVKQGKRTFKTYAPCLLCNKGIIYGQLMALERYEGHTREKRVLETICFTCTVLTDCNCDLQLSLSFSDSSNLAQNKWEIRTPPLPPNQSSGGLLFRFILSKIFACFTGP